MNMEISFRQARTEDAELLIRIYNASFYADFVRYGVCPGYGRTKENMEASIRAVPKFVISCGGEPVGCVSCRETGRNEYEIGVLCVIPAYQGRGIGTRAVEFVRTHYKDWKRFTLVTPADKTENVRFYTEKCGFRIVSAEKDGTVELTRFALERQLPDA